MKIRIRWEPEQPGCGYSTRDEDGLRELFGGAEANRILIAIGVANGEPVTLRVNGHDAGYLDLDFIDAEFSIGSDDLRAPEPSGNPLRPLPAGEKA